MKLPFDRFSSKSSKANFPLKYVGTKSTVFAFSDKVSVLGDK